MSKLYSTCLEQQIWKTVFWESTIFGIWRHSDEHSDENCLSRKTNKGSFLFGCHATSLRIFDRKLYAKFGNLHSKCLTKFFKETVFLEIFHLTEYSLGNRAIFFWVMGIFFRRHCQTACCVTMFQRNNLRRNIVYKKVFDFSFSDTEREVFDILSRFCSWIFQTTI